VAIDYARLAGVAESLIASSGRGASLVPPSAPVDPTKPWGERAAEADPIAVVAVFLGQRNDDAIPRPSVDSKTVRVLVAASAAIDALGPPWELVDGDRRYQVARVLPLKPGGLTLLYQLELAG
jgi:hypothetical protein